MPLPPKLQQKYLSRFDELIDEGEAICKDVIKMPGAVSYGAFIGIERRAPDYDAIDQPRFIAWITKCITLLSQIIKRNNTHWATVEDFRKLPCGEMHLKNGIAALKAIKDDFEKGFLGDLAAQVAAEITADYMGQADGLLQEGQSGKFDYVPAAVLAGAVLEQALRRLCDQHQPPIETTKTDGSKKTLNPLIDDLKKAEVYNEAKAKQLRVWADIRNHAAHGGFDQFKPADVERMISGIKIFLEDHCA